MPDQTILIIGEVYVDFTLGQDGIAPKMRLGGVVHAARGLWASGIEYAAAVVCPGYLVEKTKDYLRAHGCIDFFLIGVIEGAPNVIIIGDVKEVGHQGYEDILRDSKSVKFTEVESIVNYIKVVIFPGKFDLGLIVHNINIDAIVTLDIAYDIVSLTELPDFANRKVNIVISTSSKLFLELAKQEVEPLISRCREVGAVSLLLKENRGGSRFFDFEDGSVHEIPAILGDTVNSVGVGDAYTAVFAALYENNRYEAVWRGMQVATNYAQTTFPDDLRRDVARDFRIPVEILPGLGGTIIPWHARPSYQIYLAAPDFSYIEKTEIEAAVAALEYHNFKVRRPVLENGEASKGTSKGVLTDFYENDVRLLSHCSLVFAIPLGRDPGTLIEMGMAMGDGTPVVTFDPRNENNNTMVICGSGTYSNDLGACINGVFDVISVLYKDIK